MSGLRLVVRQIGADRYAAALLAAILLLGSFLGAAAPRWIDARFDASLIHVLESSGRQSELAARQTLSESPRVMDARLALVRESEPLLAQVYDEGRWAVSIGESSLIRHNGAADNPAAPREINVRMPKDLTDQVRVIEGELPSAQVGTAALPELPGNEAGLAPVVEAVAVSAVAEALELEVGDEVLLARTSVPSRDEFNPDGLPPQHMLTIHLVGLVEPVEPSWVGWTDAATARAPAVDPPGTEPRYFRGTLLADPGAIEQLGVLSRSLLHAEWHLDVVPEAVDDGDVAELIQAIRRTQVGALGWQSGLDSVLEDYTASRTSAERVSALGVASLAGLIVTLLLLAVRLVAERRGDALVLTRTRGGRTGLLAGLLATEGLLIGLPATAVGAAVAVPLFDGSGGTVGPSVIPAVLLGITLVALPAIGIRLAAHVTTDRPEHETLRPSPRRLALEAGAVLVAAVTLWVLSTRTSGPGGVDPVVSFAPVLAAAAAGLVTFRMLPFLVSAITRITRRGRGATPFLAAARAARAPGSAVLPIIALLVAIGLAAFGGAVGTTAERAQQMSSWNAVPADVVVETGTLRVEPENVAELAPDATAVAVGFTLPFQRVPDAQGRPVVFDVLAVDVSAWQRVTAAAPEPVRPVSTLATSFLPARPDGAVPAVIEGRDQGFEVGDEFTFTMQERDVTVEVVDVIPDFAGAPGSSSVIVSSAAIADSLESRWPSVIYLSGDLDEEAVAAAFDGSVTARADLLAAAEGDPILSSTLDLYDVALITAALLAAAAAVLGLLITARSRSYSLSILRTLGLTTRQATVLVAAEIVPSSIAAAIVGAGVGLGVALIATSALDLSALTGLLESGRDVVLDVPGTALTAAGVLAVVLASVILTVIASRRARLGSVLRAGDPR